MHIKVPHVVKHGRALANAGVTRAYFATYNSTI